MSGASNRAREYFEFDPARGYPAGSAIFYECVRCGGVIPSFPEDSTGCARRNIFIDVGGGRVSVQAPALMKMFRATGAE